MNETYAAFIGHRRIAKGSISAVLPRLKEVFDADPGQVVITFDEATGRQVDFDLRGTLEAVCDRCLPPSPGRGRPKIGVVSREVTLLPRHWDWLDAQPSGASAAMRRLVEEARLKSPSGLEAKKAVEAVGWMLTSLAGDLPNYEEATRALYRKDFSTFLNLIVAWPGDVADQAASMLAPALASEPVAAG